MPYYNGGKDGLIEDYETGVDFEENVKRIYQLLRKDVENTNKKVIIAGDLNAIYNFSDSYLYQNEYQKLISIKQWSFKHKKEIDVGIDDPILYPLEFYSRLKKIHINNKIEKSRHKKFELPYLFITVDELEKYFFIVWQRKYLKDLILYKRLKDTYRLFNKNLHVYTCWDIQNNLREKNWGSRIDYILSDIDEIESSIVLDDLYLSDHVPVVTTFLVHENYNSSKNIIDKKPNNLLRFFSVKENK